MTHANPVTAFLNTRRSYPAAALRMPAPEGDALMSLLTTAARVPDHGKLEPWRFIVIEGQAKERLAALLLTRGAALDVAPEKVEKAAKTWRNAPLIVAVVMVHKPSEKVPQLEQELSAGAVCVSLVNAALAQGWGAAWLTGWAAFDRDFVEQGLGLDAHEAIAGFVHLGSCDTPPVERPRPDVAALTTWLRA